MSKKKKNIMAIGLFTLIIIMGIFYFFRPFHQNRIAADPNIVQKFKPSFDINQSNKGASE